MARGHKWTNVDVAVAIFSSLCFSQPLPIFLRLGGELGSPVVDFRRSGGSGVLAKIPGDSKKQVHLNLMLFCTPHQPLPP